MFQIGSYHIDNPLVLAPMAGVTDLPFRMLCRQLGAGLVVGEMITSDTRLWNSRKSKFRLVHLNEPGPRMIQIAGGDPEMMADAASKNVEHGAQIIDINMGCPAKKVCRKAAGSALMRDEKLVAEILQTVVNAVDVPVTLKIRTGWSEEIKNAPTIARIAEDAGIAMLSVHGRTREARFKGDAEYDTIALIKQQASIPILANGDIDTPEKARQILKHTGADGLMIGRAAQGNPWIFREIHHYLETGTLAAPPSQQERYQIMQQHLNELHRFYGEYLGVRIARKHMGWYLQNQPAGKAFLSDFNRLESASDQVTKICDFFHPFDLAKETAA